MARSRKKHNYYNLVCISIKEKHNIKRLSNRIFRHRMNRGDFDGYTNTKTIHKKVIDQSWTYDLFTVRASDEDMITTDWAQKLMRK